MAIKRKSHNLDEALLKRAARVLGADTETDTIHEALRAVILGDEIMGDLESARGRNVFREDFVRDALGARGSRR